MAFLITRSERVECAIFTGDFENSAVFREVFDGFDTALFCLSCVDNRKDTNHAIEFLCCVQKGK